MHSFEELQSFREQILRVKGDTPVPMVLIGNKCDLAEQRQVMTRQGQELAKSWGCPFFETSAQAEINIEAAFREVLREYNRLCAPAPKTEKRSCVLL